METEPNPNRNFNILQISETETAFQHHIFILRITLLNLILDMYYRKYIVIHKYL